MRNGDISEKNTSSQVKLREHYEWKMMTIEEKIEFVLIKRKYLILSFFFFKNGDVFGSVRQKTVSLFPQDCAALKDLYSSRHTRTLTTIAFYWHSFPLRSQHQLKSHNYVLTELSRLTPAHTEGPVCQDIWCFSPLQSLLKDQPAMHAISDMLIFKRAAEAKWNLSLLLG